MRIFFSYATASQRQIREIKDYLPEYFDVWIDTKKLLIGDAIDKSIEKAIETKCDYMLLFIDNNSVESAWVNREVSWAFDKEDATGRVFLLPVVLQEKALEKIADPRIKDRLFAKLHHDSKPGIQLLSMDLVSNFLGLLLRNVAGDQKSESTLPKESFGGQTASNETYSLKRNPYVSVVNVELGRQRRKVLTGASLFTLIAVAVSILVTNSFARKSVEEATYTAACADSIREISKLRAANATLMSQVESAKWRLSVTQKTKATVTSVAGDQVGFKTTINGGSANTVTNTNGKE